MDRTKRGPREPARVAHGKPLGPSAAIREWYADQMLVLARRMIAEYKDELAILLETGTIPNHAMDAAAPSIFDATLRRLFNRWKSIFDTFGKRIASSFVEKSEVAATSSVAYSLKAAGVKQPKTQYNKNVANTMGAAIAFNHTLVSNVSMEIHRRIFNAVMMSLTSPEPEKQGASGIANELREIGGFAERRIELISRDQTSKLFCSLSQERMKQNGVTHFRWLHSSAGKVPRQSHVDKDGEIFEVDDPRLWEGPEADRGPPGWAINCRCRAQPII